MLMSENHNNHRSMWQQVSTEKPLPQSNGSRGVGRSNLISPVWGGGWFLFHITCAGGGGRNKREEEIEGHHRIIRTIGKSQIINTWY
jgi:hypothetical protein